MLDAYASKPVPLNHFAKCASSDKRVKRVPQPQKYPSVVPEKPKVTSNHAHCRLGMRNLYMKAPIPNAF